MGTTESERGARMWQDALSRRQFVRLGGIASAGALLGTPLLAACGSDDGSGTASTATKAGTTASGELKPFDPGAPAGTAPSLPKRFGLPGAFDDSQSLAFSDQIKTAAESRGLDYTMSVANGDLTKITDQTSTMFAQGVGAIFQYPYEIEATSQFSQQAIDQGVCVMSVLRPLSHVQWVNDLEADGVAIGEAAVRWAKANADGKAKVLLFHQDKANPASIVQHRATVAALKDGGPGIEIVAEVDEKGSAEENANVVTTLLQAHPDITVVLGSGTAAPGAFTAFDAQGKGDSPDVYVGVYAAGDDVLDKIARGGSIVRAAFLYSGPVVGYGLGLYAADWLDGKSIPRLLTPPSGAAIELSTPAAVAEYRDDMKNAGRTWETKREKYVELWGNISYDTREDYWRELGTAPNAKRA